VARLPYQARAGRRRLASALGSVSVALACTAALEIGGAAVVPGASASPIAAGTTKLVDLPAVLVPTYDNYTAAGASRCTDRVILLVAAPDHVVDITGVARDAGTGVAGTHFDMQVPGGPGFTNPITGYGPPYTVPKGEEGWFMGGGSGPAPCGNALATWSDPRGFGYIPDNLVLVSGTATNQSGTPVPGAHVDISGPDHVTATTDSVGAFAELVHKGTYTVTLSPPAADAGAQVKAVSCETGAIAGDRCSGDTKNVGLKAGFHILLCPGSVGGPSRASDLLALAAPTSASGADAHCPLNVSVVALGPTVAGLSYIGARAGDTAPAFTHSATFIRDLTGLAPLPGGSGKTPTKCATGCTDLLVTVTNRRTGKPVARATVDASVTPITTGFPIGTPYPGKADAGFLCDLTIITPDTTSQATHCGSTGTQEDNDLVTNTDGQVLLRYWMPAVIKNEKVVVIARAMSPCTKVCTLGGKGRGRAFLTVKPHILVDVKADPFNQDDIEKWANPPSIVDILINPLIVLPALIESKLTSGAMSALPPALQTFLTVKDWLSGHKADQQQQIGFSLSILNPLGISPYGLDDSSTTGMPNVLMNNDLIDLLSSPSTQYQLTKAFSPVGPISGLGDNGGGLAWQFGEALGRPVSNGGRPWSVTAAVYEMSYCEQSAEVADPSACGPGYTTANSYKGSRDRGIEPYLYFYFQFSDNEIAPFTVTRFFVIPYNADAWMYAQFKDNPSPLDASLSSH
jgi:hypothetical protein